MAPAAHGWRRHWRQGAITGRLALHMSSQRTFGPNGHQICLNESDARGTRGLWGQTSSFSTLAEPYEQRPYKWNNPRGKKCPNVRSCSDRFHAPVRPRFSQRGADEARGCPSCPFRRDIDGQPHPRAPQPRPIGSSLAITSTASEKTRAPKFGHLVTQTSAII